MSRIVRICAAFLPAALGLGLVQLFIDGRIDGMTAFVGIVVLVLVSTITAGIRVESRGRLGRRRRSRERD